MMKKIYGLMAGALLLASCAKTPEASFTSAETGPLQVTFTNTTTDGSTYLWELDGTNTSTDESPVHTFDTRGDYTVKLTSNSKNGKKTHSVENAVTVANPLSGEYSVTSMKQAGVESLQGTMKGDFKDCTGTTYCSYDRYENDSLVETVSYEVIGGGTTFRIYHGNNETFDMTMSNLTSTGFTIAWEEDGVPMEATFAK